MKKTLLEARAHVIAYRMAAELADELQCTLKPKELVALCRAAIVIAVEPSELKAALLEEYTVSRAFDMVAIGH